MGRYLEDFSPPMVWNFTPKQLQDPGEVIEYWKGKCSACSREAQLTTLCWALATIYQPLLDIMQHPRGKGGKTDRQALQLPQPTLATGTAAEPTCAGVSRPYAEKEIHGEIGSLSKGWR